MLYMNIKVPEVFNLMNTLGRIDFKHLKNFLYKISFILMNRTRSKVYKLQKKMT